MYEDAKWVDEHSEHICITIFINGVQSAVPLDPANTDYQNIMQLVAEGKLTIAPAE